MNSHVLESWVGPTGTQPWSEIGGLQWICLRSIQFSNIGQVEIALTLTETEKKMFHPFSFTQHIWLWNATMRSSSVTLGCPPPVNE